MRRVSEEAEVFAAEATRLIAEETLVQRALKARRFMPRIGAAAVPRVDYVTREIVSEYGYGTLSEAPDSLHELRRVVSVDGKPVEKRDKARETLTAGIRSEDDRLKKRLLRDFEKHGLTGTATDFGQLLLLFRGDPRKRFGFGYQGVARLGPDQAVIYAFEQLAGDGGLTIFEGNQALRQKLRGELWVRQADAAPLRIVLRSERLLDQEPVLDEGTVDYTRSAHNIYVPASVVYRQVRGDTVLVENTFRYSVFRKFSAAAEVRFTEAPEEPAPAPPARKP